MIKIKKVSENDKKFWFSLDCHFTESEFKKKVRDGTGYVIFEDDKPAGILRYNLFWDNTPFMNMLYVADEFQKKGYGRALVEFWEKEMKSLGYGMVMTSTQVDETAQHFYRKLGFLDAGGIVFNIPGYEQPMEMVLMKKIQFEEKL